MLKGKINESFGRALAEYNTADYLDDIRETVVDNRRVLAVKSYVPPQGARHSAG